LEHIVEVDGLEGSDFLLLHSIFLVSLFITDWFNISPKLFQIGGYYFLIRTIEISVQLSVQMNFVLSMIKGMKISCEPIIQSPIKLLRELGLPKNFNLFT
jgi:hypothetical protein